jgi:hypothetical protein
MDSPNPAGELGTPPPLGHVDEKRTQQCTSLASAPSSSVPPPQIPDDYEEKQRTEHRYIQGAALLHEALKEHREFEIKNFPEVIRLV